MVVVLCSTILFSLLSLTCAESLHCGTSLAPLVTHGRPLSKGEYPWLVALYQQKSNQWIQFCGGALLTRRIVLTAAHCLVFDRTVMKPEDLRVGLGKLYRDYYHDEDYSTIANVERIVAHPRFLGSLSYYALDVALLKLSITVGMADHILPVCIDLDTITTVSNGTKVYAAGWGTSENGTSTERALAADLSYLENHACLIQVRFAYRQYVTHEKICARSINGSQVDRGDSGGALTFTKNGHHYAIGVVSTKAVDTTSFSIFTDLTNPEINLWIKQQIAYLSFTESDTECTLPARPDNSRFSPVAGTCGNHTEETWEDGARVPSGCVILFSWDEGYQRENNQPYSICEDSDWVPEPSFLIRAQIALARTTDVSSRAPKLGGCLLPIEARNRRFLPWVPATDTSRLVFYAPGSKITRAAKVQCEPGYILPDNQEFIPIVCRHGKWITGEIPECQKLCPPLESSSMYISCKDGTKDVDCSRPMLPSTRVTYQCRPGYKEYLYLAKDGVYKRNMTCQSDGKWSYVLPECRIACGLSRRDDALTPTIIDGGKAHLGQFPWHATIYKHINEGDLEWKDYCGGSLVSSRVVLTAAGCVSGNVPDQLRVVLGKIYRSWDADDDHHAKICNVSEIKALRENDGFNIVLLLLSESVEFNSFIMPICTNINMDFDIAVSTETYVLGWSKNEEDKKMETLLYLKLDVWNVITITENFYSISRVYRRSSTGKLNKNIAEHVWRIPGVGSTAVFDGVHYIFGVVTHWNNEVTMFENITRPDDKDSLKHEIELFDGCVQKCGTRASLGST